MSKLKAASAVVLALCLAGGGALAQRSLSGRPGEEGPAKREAAAAPAVQEKGAEPSAGSYVRIRVGVEIRGTLGRSGKGLTITALYAGPTSDAEEPPRVQGGPSVFRLNFARAEKLRERAQALVGREVIVLGTSELREGPATPGAPGRADRAPASGSGWGLRHEVLVTGIDETEAGRPPEPDDQARWQRLARASILRYLDRPERKELAAAMKPFLDRPGHLTIYAGGDNAVFVDHLRGFASRKEASEDKEAFERIAPRNVVVVYLRGVEGGSPSIGVIFDKKDGKELAITTVLGK